MRSRTLHLFNLLAIVSFAVIGLGTSTTGQSSPATVTPTPIIAFDPAQVSAVGDYSVAITSVSPAPPNCVLRNSSDSQDRRLELTGENFPTVDHHLQFRRVDNGTVSIHFGVEVNWESPTRITVDMDSIKHLLWSDSKVRLSVRLTDNSYSSVSDWSSEFNLADDDTACSAPIVNSVNPSLPYCVLRNSSSAYARLLELTGENFPSTDHHLQFRKVDDGAESIHFGMEVNWESSTRITVDMDSIKHLLWSGSKITLTVRLTGDGYEPVSSWSPEFYLANDDDACNAVDNGWTVFRDLVYGYKIQLPASWHTYPANGVFGSITMLSSVNRDETAVPDNAIRIQVGVANYDRDLQVSLKDWVTIPSRLASRVVVSTDQPGIFTNQMVIESYDTPEGSIRRAYIARGQKVYIVDLVPDDPSQYALFASILQSFAFTDPFYRNQEVRSRLFGNAYGDYYVYLPLITKSGMGYSVSSQSNLSPQNVPLNYRLPFVGQELITQGPGCWTTHQDNDFEAIDFDLDSGTSVYASEGGQLIRQPNMQGYGNTVWIQHGDGRMSWYSHLREFMATNGHIDKEGLIGWSGGGLNDPGRGTSTGDHLHFMIDEPNKRKAEWIRTMPGITWYSGDPNNPCQSQLVDGYGIGPEIGSNPPQICQTSLNSPSDDVNLTSPEIDFNWNTVACATNGYIFRIKDVPDMRNGGTTIRDTDTGTTQQTETIEPYWHDQDLYWSVIPANIANAEWSPARRFRVTATPPSSCPSPNLNSPSNGATFTSGSITFDWDDVSCSHQGFTFRIKTVADMESGGDTVIDIGHGTTQRTQTIETQWYNRDLYWSVKAANAPNADWATSRRFRVSPTAPLGRPTLSSPSNGASLPQNTDVVLSWNTASGATQYKVEVWGGAYSLMTLCDWQSETRCHVGQMWPGTMSWHVRARDASGQESDWSDTWTFSIEQTVPTVDAPALSSPSNGSSMPQSTDVTLSWNTASNATQYTVEVWGGPYDKMTVCQWQSGTSCHLGQMWPGTMYWHVKARGANGQESVWSNTWSFTIEQGSTPAGKPTLSGPSNGASMPQSTDVTLIWDTSSGATEYKVELWGGPYSTMTPCNWQSGTSCHIGQMWPGTMSWHVKARNTSGQESDWSDTWSFTIKETSSEPDTPTLSSPSNGASLPQSTEVTLNWNTSSGATEYKVELWGGPYDLMTPCDWQSGISCHIGQMWPGTMSWHVKARNSNGESDWSETWSFTIQETPSGPDIPTLSSPSNGASMPQSTEVALNWNTSSGATEYKVELWGGPYDLMTPCDWQSGTSCHIGQMWPGTMSWHVKARNSDGESDWSETWSFTIQEAPSGPDTPTLSSPSNGASMPQSTEVALNWNTSSGATEYKVELWGGPYDLMTPCDWQSGTSCHIGQMWPGTMSWHVRARNSDGESDWSDTWSFTIEEPPPTPTPEPSWKPTLSSPGNGSSWPQSTDITLVWNSLSGATQYKVELWGGPYNLMTPCDWQSGTSCHIGQMWPGTMSWHVKARNSSEESDWSDIWSFTIQN